MSLNDRLAAFFKAHPHEWIPMRTLADLAGVGGWRNRVTDLRLKYGMTIENRVRTEHRAGCAKVFAADLEEVAACDCPGPWKISEYRYEPPADTQPSALQGHDLNVPWSLR